MQPNPDVQLLELQFSLWNLSMLKWTATMNWLHPNLPKGSCYTLECNFDLLSEVGATKAKRKTETPCQTTCLGWNRQEGNSRTDRVWGNHGCAVKCFWDSHQLTTFVYPNHIPRLSCFQQDNNQKYTSHLASSFMEEQGIHWSKNPPE